LNEDFDVNTKYFHFIYEKQDVLETRQQFGKNFATLQFNDVAILTSHKAWKNFVSRNPTYYSSKK